MIVIIIYWLLKTLFVQYMIYHFRLRPLRSKILFNCYSVKSQQFHIFFVLKYMTYSSARIRRQLTINKKFTIFRYEISFIRTDKWWWMKWLSKKRRRVYCTLLLYQGYIFVWFRCNHALWYHIQSNSMRKSDTGRYFKMDLFSYWIKFLGQIHWRYVSSFHSKVWKKKVSQMFSIAMKGNLITLW